MKPQKACCALLVASTESYLEEAALTCRLLHAFGAADYFHCYTSSSSSPVEQEGFSPIRYQHSGNWSEELLSTLHFIPQPYVLLWLDDLIPLTKPNFLAVQDVVDYLIRTSGDYVRLNPTPRGRGRIAPHDLRLIHTWEPYRTSTILSVWRTATLRSLLRPGETAWAFERNSTQRSVNYHHFYASSKHLAPFANLVVKGFIEPTAEAKIISAGISTTSIHRARMTRSMQFRHALANYRSMFARKYLDPLSKWRATLHLRGNT